MAASIDYDEWTVLMKCPHDKQKTKTYTMHKSTTIAELKQKWAKDVHSSTKGLTLKTVSGDVTEDSDELQNIGESHEGLQIVTFIVHESVEINFKVHKQRIKYKTVSTPLSVQVKTLEPTVCQHFNIPSEQDYQLWYSRGLLKRELSLEAQSVKAKEEILVDLEYNILLTNVWFGDGYVEDYFLFSSDSCDILLSDCICSKQRLLYEKKIINTENDIASALMPLGILNQVTFPLERHVLQDLTLLIERKFEELFVWPTDNLKKENPHCPPLFFDGELVDKKTEFKELDLPDNAFFLSAPIGVLIKVRETREHYYVHVSRLGTVGDIKAALVQSINARQKKKAEERKMKKAKAEQQAEEEMKEEMKEEDITIADFDLRRKTRVLDCDESIEDAGIFDGDALNYERKRLTVTVRLEDRSVRLRKNKSSMRFTEIMAVMAEMSKVDYDQLLRMTLRCTGCGRRICRKMELSQMIPAPCCETASLDLEELPRTREIGTQLFCRRKRMARTRAVGKPPNTRTKTCQAVAYWHQVGSQTDSFMTEFGSQTELEQTEFSQQHSPPAAGHKSVMKTPNNVDFGSQTVMDRSHFRQQHSPPAAMHKSVMTTPNSVYSAFKQQHSPPTAMHRSVMRIPDSAEFASQTAKATSDFQQQHSPPIALHKSVMRTPDSNEIGSQMAVEKSAFQQQHSPPVPTHKSVMSVPNKAAFTSQTALERSPFQQQHSRPVALHKSVMKTPDKADKNMQSSGLRSSHVQQHPPPTPRRLLIMDVYRGRTVLHDFYMMEPITVGAVRCEIARKIGRSPNELRLKRCFGWRERSADLALIATWTDDYVNPKYYSSAEFSDEAGTICLRDDLERWSFEWLDNDNDICIITPDRRNVIHAHRR